MAVFDHHTAGTKWYYSSSQYNRREMIKRSLLSSDIQENIWERMFAIFVFLTRVNVFPNGLHAYNDVKT